MVYTLNLFKLKPQHLSEIKLWKHSGNAKYGIADALDWSLNVFVGSPPFLALCLACWRILSGWECFSGGSVKDKAHLFSGLKEWINFRLHYLISDLNQLPNPFHPRLALQACWHLLTLTFNLDAMQNALGGGSGCLLSCLCYEHCVDEVGLFLYPLSFWLAERTVAAHQAQNTCW